MMQMIYCLMLGGLLGVIVSWWKYRDEHEKRVREVARLKRLLEQTENARLDALIARDDEVERLKEDNRVWREEFRTRTIRELNLPITPEG